MTPEEEQRLRAYLARIDMDAPPITMESQVAAAMTAPMTPGTAGFGDMPRRPDPREAATRSLKGRENQVKSQRAYANTLRGREMPQGRTVGPYDVYVAPNWGESLAGAMNPVIGGYLANKANEADIELDEDRAAKAVAALEYQEGLTADERDFEAQQTGLKLALDRELGELKNTTAIRGQDLTAAASAASTAATIANRGSTEAGLGRRSEVVSQRERPDGTTFDIVTVPGEGVFMYDRDQPGGRGAPADLTGTIPLDTRALGSTATLDTYNQKQADQEAADIWASQVGLEQKQAQMAATADSFANVITNPDVDKFSGYLSLPRVLAVAGIGEDAWKGQAIDQQLKAGSTALVADMASIFKPMSDTDLKYLLSQFPSTLNEPEAITAWLGTNGRMKLRETYQTARAELKTDEQKANMDKMWKQTEAKLDASIAQAAFRQGIKASDARSIGMDPEELEYLYARMAGG